MEGVKLKLFYLLTIFVSLVVIESRVEASSINHPEDIAISRLNFLISVYKNDTGKLPDNWTNLNAKPEHQEILQDLVNKTLGDNIQKYYSFAPPNLRVSRAETYHSESEGGKVLIIGNGPLKKPATSEHGRYVIWADEDDQTTVSWLSESKVKAIYERSEIAYSANNLNQPRNVYVPKPAGEVESQNIDMKPGPATEANTESFVTSKSDNQSEVAVTENQPTQPTTSFPWLFVIVGIILLAVIAVVGFKFLGKSS